MPLNPGPSFCRKSIAILAIAGLLLPPASADLSEAREAAKRVPPKSSGPLTGASGQNSAMSMQMPMVFPLFLQNQEFSSTLVLTSAAAQSTYADIILTRTDGREITHQRVEFTPHSQRTVEVLTLLESVVSPATTGTITIFQAPEFTDTMVILGQLAITYKGSREPNYVDEEVAMPSTRGSQILRAVADAGVGSPVVALTNLSMEAQHVSIECIGENRGHPSKSLALKGNGTALIEACSPETTFGGSFESFPSSSSDNAEHGPVGISLKGDGMPGTLAAFGLRRHKRADELFYSAVTFVDSMMLKSPNTVFDGVAVGAADPLGGGKYVPELSLTNFSTSDLHVQVTYAEMSGAAPMTSQIADVTLAAGTSKQMTFADLHGDPQLQNSFLVASNGEAGDVLAKLVSSDRDAPSRIVELLGKDAQDTNNGGSNPWTIENGAESTLLLFNHDQAPQIFNVLIAAADGTQWNKDFKVAPMETRAISVGELIQNAVKDDKGKTLPKTAVSGQISWWTVGTPFGPGHGRLLLSSRLSGMARSFACGCPYILCGMTFDTIISALESGQTITSLDQVVPQICLHGINNNCTGKISSFSSSQALSYGWTTSNSGIISIPGSTTNSVVGGYGAGVGTATMTGKVSAQYFNPTLTCTFQGGGNNNVTPKITQDRSLWFFGLGNTPPSGFSGGTTATLTASGGGNGTYIWTVTTGTSKLTFENNSTTIAKTNVNTVGITSTSYSTAANDVTIQLQFTPSGGSQLTVNYQLSIDSPYKLVSNGMTTNQGVAYTGAQSCTNAQSGSDGFLSLVPYKMQSFFGVIISNEYINESFTNVQDIYVGNNWPVFSPGFYLSPDGTFFDRICVAGPVGSGTPQPLPPQNPLSTIQIDKASQAWYVGSQTSASGVQVQANTINRFQDHGTHTNVQSPVR